MKKKILIIEDDTRVLENISDLLTEEGYDVFDASNGIDGLAQIEKTRPDLVICDIAMPGMDGLQLLKRTRDEKINFDKPFILLSARTSKDNIREGMNLGADDYITKPYTRKEILEAVSIRLQKSNMLDKKNSTLRENIAAALPRELLTPLNNIYMTSDLLMAPYNELTQDEIFEYGEKIHFSAEKIKHVFSKYISLLDIYLIRSDESEYIKLNKEICSLPNDIIKMVASDLAEQYGRPTDLAIKAIRSSIGISDSHLFRIVYELVDNAFKFSAPGTLVTVLGGISFSNYLLSVSNTGKGMSKEEVSLIGEFMKFDKGDGNAEGLGLGLVIAKKLCENYKADFSVLCTENSVTVNCRFKIRK